MRWTILLLAAAGCVAFPTPPTGASAAPAPAGEFPPGPCRAALDFVAGRIEANYPGLADKVTPATRGAYDRHTEQARARADSARTDEACHVVLAGWTGFFQDRHIGVSFSRPAAQASQPAGDTTAAGIRARFSAAPARPLGEEAARQSLAARPERDAIEGIYEQINGNYRLAIVPDTAPGTFVAVVLRADSVWWVPGQVKAWFARRDDGQYDTRFHMRDHTGQAARARLAQNVLKVALPGGESWFLRTEPRMPDDLAMADHPRTLSWPTRFERLSEQTVALHVQSFFDDQAPLLDSILVRHGDEIARARNLIIDVQSNPGGSDYVFGRLLPLLYTDPILRVPHRVLATPDNVQKFEAVLANPAFPESEKDGIRALVAALRQAPEGTLVRRGSEDWLRLTPSAQPERVAVVVDRGCGSSCEQFVLAARQSRKVTVYGENTAGVVDYGNVHTLPVPGSPFQLIYPTSRSERLPHARIDPQGITPDVPIPEDEPYRVRWVQRRMESP